MTYPIFLNTDQIMSIIMAELPSNVYAEDRADHPDPSKRSYSSSELRAYATMLASFYENLELVFKDKFISTVSPESLSSWESLLFSNSQDAMQSYEVRQMNLLTKFRARGGISYTYLYNLVYQILNPLGFDFDLVAWGGQNNGGWILDFTQLDVGTYLGYEDPLLGMNQDLIPLDCNLDYVAAGITAQDLEDIQTTAYTYELRIYGDAPQNILDILNQTLTQAEVAGSTHVITNNFPLPPDPDNIDFGLFTGDTLMDNLDCGQFISLPLTYNILDFGGF